MITKADQINNTNTMVHILRDGTKVIGISHHDFVFSDGSKGGRQNPEIVDALTLQRQFSLKGHVGNTNMAINEVRMILNAEQQIMLQKLESMADIVILPFPVLTALREQNIRHLFTRCLAFNCTADTQRCAPADKVVDITNWSW